MYTHVYTYVLRGHFGLRLPLAEAGPRADLLFKVSVFSEGILRMPLLVNGHGLEVGGQ